MKELIEIYKEDLFSNDGKYEYIDIEIAKKILDIYYKYEFETESEYECNDDETYKMFRLVSAAHNTFIKNKTTHKLYEKMKEVYEQG